MVIGLVVAPSVGFHKVVDHYSGAPRYPSNTMHQHISSGYMLLNKLVAGAEDVTDILPVVILHLVDSTHNRR